MKSNIKELKDDGTEVVLIKGGNTHLYNQLLEYDMFINNVDRTDTIQIEWSKSNVNKFLNK